MSKKIAVSCTLCALGALIFSSAKVISSCRYALSLCAELIIPSLFPFFILSALLNRLGFPAMLSRLLSGTAGRLFGVSGTGASAFIIGLTGGYPLGAAYTADMLRTGVISSDEAERLLGFCNNSGPAFIIGAVGVGVFSSARAGLYLYAVHIFSAAATGVLLRFCCGTTEASHAAQSAEATDGLPISLALPDAVKQAVVSIANVCGFVVCFTVLVGLLDTGGAFSLAVGWLAARTGWEMHWLRALLTGILELGSGVGAMRAMSISPLNLALAAFLVGWGGISVHFQTRAVIADSAAKGALHFAGRLISACISAVAIYFMYPFVF